MQLSTLLFKAGLLFCCLFAGCSFTAEGNSERIKAYAQADAVVAMVFALQQDESTPQPEPDNNPSNECTNCYGTGKSGDGLSICTVCNGTGKTQWKPAIIVEPKQQSCTTGSCPTPQQTSTRRFRLGLFRKRYVPQRKAYNP